MPQNVRNFWIELEVDGKKTAVATGPRRKDGGFTMRILMRENGGISERKVHLSGVVDKSGNLRLLVTPYGSSDYNNLGFILESKR